MERVAVVEHDPEWAQAYLREAGRVRAVLGPLAVAVEHIGSTAVPGLVAKPIIDLLVGVRTLDDAPACVTRIAELGYEYVAAFEEVMPYRRFFRRDLHGVRTHHLHLVERTHPFFTEHVALRDYLRVHPDDARRYGDLKRELASAHPSDIHAYMDGKDALIRELNASALAWLRAQLDATEVWSASPDR